MTNQPLTAEQIDADNKAHQIADKFAIPGGSWALYNAIVAYAAQQNAELVASKDRAYAERNKCVVGLALLARDLGYKVGLARHPEEDKTWEDDWRNIVFIELPTGQLSWHMHDSDMYMLYSFCREPYEWDGHSTEEKYRRLLDYTPQNYNLQAENERLKQHNKALIPLAAWAKKHGHSLGCDIRDSVLRTCHCTCGWVDAHQNQGLTTDQHLALADYSDSLAQPPKEAT